MRLLLTRRREDAGSPIAGSSISRRLRAEHEVEAVLVTAVW